MNSKNLLSPNEIEKAKKFRSVGAVGPGGCSSEFACQVQEQTEQFQQLIPQISQPQQQTGGGPSPEERYSK